MPHTYTGFRWSVDRMDIRTGNRCSFIWHDSQPYYSVKVFEWWPLMFFYLDDLDTFPGPDGKVYWKTQGETKHGSTKLLTQ